MGNHGTTAILTDRESEVAERIAWGASQKEVATELGISRYTVDNTLRKVYDKLHIGKSTSCLPGGSVPPSASALTSLRSNEPSVSVVYLAFSWWGNTLIMSSSAGTAPGELQELNQESMRSYEIINPFLRLTCRQCTCMQMHRRELAGTYPTWHTFRIWNGNHLVDLTVEYLDDFPFGDKLDETINRVFNLTDEEQWPYKNLLNASRSVIPKQK